MVDGSTSGSSNDDTAVEINDVKKEVEALAKPAAAKSAAVKPAEAKPAPVKLAEAKPAATKPATTKPAAAKPVAAKLATEKTTATTTGLEPPEVWKPEMAKSPVKEAERDVVKEYVLQEEEKIAKRRAKNLPLKFSHLKPVSVAKNRAKMQQSSGIPVRTVPTKPETGNTTGKRKPFAPRSMSTANLMDFKRNKSVAKMGSMSRHSMERLPTLSAFDEERIHWLKNLEDSNMLAEERRARSKLR